MTTLNYLLQMCFIVFPSHFHWLSRFEVCQHIQDLVLLSEFIYYVSTRRTTVGTDATLAITLH